jgi:hypothetical protein
MAITSITKEGSVLVILTSERPNPFKFDCKEKVLYSFTGKPLKRISPILSNAVTNMGEIFLINAIKDVIGGYGTRELNIIEPFALYLDMVKCRTIDNMPPSCPKGYIKWLKEKSLSINDESYKKFSIYNKLKNLSPRVMEVLEVIEKGIGDDYRWNNFMENADSNKITLVTKIFHTTIKGICWDLRGEMVDFLYEIRNYREWEKVVDTNRTFDYNIKLIENAKNAERNKEILEFEETIRDIENLSNDTFTIIVPRTIEDFTNEGNMQNNCVGYFYHDSIARHDNLVYFIRKATNPNHSYITNRYSTCSKRTVETRKVNNSDNNDKSALELIKAIDSRIRELLEKEETA